MAIKFKSIPFRYMPGRSHCSYCQTVSEALSEAPPELLASLGTLPDEFNKLLAVEIRLANWVRKSNFTEKIAETGHRMDKTLVAIKLQVCALQHSPAPDIAGAAYRINIMLKNYGRIYRKPYSGKISNLLTVLRHLNGDYADDALRLGLAEHMNELQKACEEFGRLIELRNEESLGKPDENFKTVMRNIEKVYHRITHIIEAGATMRRSPDYEYFIKKLNPVIERFYAVYHRVRRKMSLAQPEGIPPQTYTGLSVTPVPVVFYTTPKGETVRLQLGKDYDISYRNNTKPGTAQCIFRGKGLYAGKRMVTFVIRVDGQ